MFCDGWDGFMLISVLGQEKKLFQMIFFIMDDVMTPLTIEKTSNIEISDYRLDKEGDEEDEEGKKKRRESFLFLGLF
ncbi:hypothetical protein SS1G_03163 [Sclerotinia sclerotiorum 1980 UF-70]|uniref:Uncharacterized protein n=1 Tax=Sclerotinia sclerotiorum (strain ATCC 18683 / 1980 / Ss-1) TaxID=665079 RepID=A7ECX4_SCLS1|nr:hypothetical protein SS1G_03163 [Sclerotinia sclerotiorum 1980 UF-70]EDO00690.1 hypothetical protein SS1G_03163 [Sclerotinia sclerotiorum 1980 UF-70]